jgi:fucose permease
MISAPPSASAAAQAAKAARLRSATLVVVILSYALFILLGMPDAMLGIAWPSMRAVFGMPLDALGQLLMASTIGYIISSFTVGRMIKRLGMLNLLLVGALLRAAGLAAYALAPEWWMLLSVGLLIGIGGGMVDAGLNTYFAVNFGTRLMNWLHAAFGLGATAGPILMTALITGGAGWRWGYGISALLQLALVVAVFLRRADWNLLSAASAPAGTDQKETATSALHRPYTATLTRSLVWLQILLFFLFTGVEASAGNWSFTLFTEGRGVDAATAGFWVSFYWGSFTFSRVIFGWISEKFSTTLLLMTLFVLTVVAAAMLWWNPVNEVGFAGLALMGFALAPIFPLVTSTTPARLGTADAENAIGIQIAAAGLGKMWGWRPLAPFSSYFQWWSCCSSC